MLTKHQELNSSAGIYGLARVFDIRCIYIYILLTPISKLLSCPYKKNSFLFIYYYYYLFFWNWVLQLDIPKEVSLEKFLNMFRSWSPVNTAKDQGVDLLSESMVKEFESAWGGPTLVRSIIFKGFMLAGKVRL